MITVISRFPVGDLETTRTIFKDSVPRYQSVPGLVRKHYYVDGTGYGGGVYLFRSRKEAEALFNETFFANIKQRFGETPTVTYLETLLVLDNEVGTVVDCSAAA